MYSLNHISSCGLLLSSVAQASVGTLTMKPFRAQTKFPRIGGKAQLSKAEQTIENLRNVGDRRAIERLAAKEAKAAARVVAAKELAEQRADDGTKTHVRKGWSLAARFALLERALDTDISDVAHRDGVRVRLFVAKPPKGVFPLPDDWAAFRGRVLAKTTKSMAGSSARILSTEFTHAGQPHLNILMVMTLGEAEDMQDVCLRQLGYTVSAMTAEEKQEAFYIREHNPEAPAYTDHFDEWCNSAAYMAGVSEKLKFEKAHQYETPDYWLADGVKIGKMWNSFGLKSSEGIEVAIENIVQRKANDTYLAHQTSEDIREYEDRETGEITAYDNGLFRSGRRYGSKMNRQIFDEMKDDLLSLIARYANPDFSEIIRASERGDWQLVDELWAELLLEAEYFARELAMGGKK